MLYGNIEEALNKYKSDEKISNISNTGSEKLICQSEQVVICSYESVTGDFEKNVTDRNCYKWCVTNSLLVPTALAGKEDDRIESVNGPNYTRLILSEISSLDADLCLPVAMFLFAMRLVRECAPSDLSALCKRYAPHWRKRIEPRGWAMVVELIQDRIKEFGIDINV